MIFFSTGSARLAVALKTTTRALDDSYGWLVLWLPLVPVVLIVYAVVVTGFDAASNSFGLGFLAGLVATGNFFFITFGGFFSTLFFAGLMWKQRQTTASIGSMAIS
jgi:hypothetical protein